MPGQDKYIPNNDEQDLFRRIAEGEVTAFEALFLAYYDAVYGTALAYGKSRELAEDVTQQIFLKVWERRAELGSVERPVAWLHTAARYQVLHALDKEWSKEQYLRQVRGEMQSDADRPDDAAELREQQALISKAIGSLPARQAEVFRLSREEGLTYAQIGARLGISAETVKEHMAKALKTLRIELAGHGDYFFCSAVFLHYFFT